MNLLNKERYRDDEFEKGVKGTWILRTDIAIQQNDGGLFQKVWEGMLLKLNRNTKKGKRIFL